MKAPGAWLVVALALAVGPVAAETSPGGAAPALKILTFNVWHGLRSGESKKRFPGEEAARKAERFAWQIEELRRLDPDVLLLQEVNPNQREAGRYAAALGYDEIHKVTNCGLHLGFLYKIPKNVNEGIAILAKPDLGLRRAGKKRLSGNAWCTASLGFQTKESRYALFGEISIQGRRVLVVTTHLSSPPYMPPGFETAIAGLTEEGRLDEAQRDEILGILARKRTRNVAEVEALLSQIARHRREMAGSDRAPVILGGDFNTEPETAGITTVVEAQFRNVATGPDFLTWDPVRNQVNYGIGTKRADPVPTFGVSEVQELLTPRQTTARQIDFLFVSDDLDPESAQMVLDRERNGIYPSDHFGILATIRLAPSDRGGQD